MYSQYILQQSPVLSPRCPYPRGYHFSVFIGRAAPASQLQSGASSATLVQPGALEPNKQKVPTKCSSDNNSSSCTVPSPPQPLLSTLNPRHQPQLILGHISLSSTNQHTPLCLVFETLENERSHLHQRYAASSPDACHTAVPSTPSRKTPC